MKTLIIAILAIFALSSCRTVQTVTEIEYRDRVVVNTRLDSVFLQVRDSVFIRERGDTVTIERWSVRYRDRVIERTDTLHLTHEVVREVETTIKERASGFRNFLAWLGGISLIALLLFLFFKWWAWV